jgi:hypothetical protein
MIFCIILISALDFLNPQAAIAESWGFYAHRKINYLAALHVPQSDLFDFMKRNIAYLEEHAVDPDKRRYANSSEAPRHYIDIDYYGEYPFRELPRNWDSAVAKYGQDTLEAYGIAPWHILRSYQSLIWAFSNENHSDILRHAADLGHYVADIHVPLHCTMNYNGDLTGQHGIHAFWESRLPELFGDQYFLFCGRARYVSDPEDLIWSVVLESAAALDSVLQFEKASKESLKESRLFAFESRGSTMQRLQSERWSGLYHQLLDGMVERRMCHAVHRVASLWYSAWIEAGMPIMGTLLLRETHLGYKIDSIQSNLDSLEFYWKQGEIKGRSHDH